jgi:hypothetical protein
MKKLILALVVASLCLVAAKCGKGQEKKAPRGESISVRLD